MIKLVMVFVSLFLAVFSALGFVIHQSLF